MGEERRRHITIFDLIGLIVLLICARAMTISVLQRLRVGEPEAFFISIGVFIANIALIVGAVDLAAKRYRGRSARR